MPNGAMNGPASDDAKFAALEQRVYGLERGVGDLSSTMSVRFGDVTASIAGLGAKLDERSRTPWATIVSAMGVVLAIVIAGGQLAKAPIDNAIVRLERDTTLLDTTTTPLAIFSEFKGTYENNRLLNRQDIDAKGMRADQQLRDMDGRLRDLASNVVPRAELRDDMRLLTERLDRIERAK